jgi:hypothetical protein
MRLVVVLTGTHKARESGAGRLYPLEPIGLHEAELRRFQIGRGLSPPLRASSRERDVRHPGRGSGFLLISKSCEAHSRTVDPSHRSGSVEKLLKARCGQG